MAGNKGRAREGFPEEVSLRKSAQCFVVGPSEHGVPVWEDGGSPWPLRT